MGKRIHKKLTEKTNWYRKKKENDTKRNFIGLNANGLPDAPIRKRKRSEDEGMHHHQLVGGDTMVELPREHHQPNV